MLFLFWAFSTWIGVPAIQTIVAGLSEDARGTMLALNTSAQSLGQVVGPIVTGQMLVLGGFALAGPYAALVGLVALAHRVRRPASPGEHAGGHRTGRRLTSGPRHHEVVRSRRAAHRGASIVARDPDRFRLPIRHRPPIERHPRGG